MKKKQDKQQKKKQSLVNLEQGIAMIKRHPFFGNFDMYIRMQGKSQMGKNLAVIIDKNGILYANEDRLLAPAEWAYLLTHQYLHLSFGHFDAEKMIGENRPLRTEEQMDLKWWNLACDLYIIRFLKDMKWGELPFGVPDLPKNVQEEQEIYEYLHTYNHTEAFHEALAEIGSLIHMEGLDKPIVYLGKNINIYRKEFAVVLSETVADTIADAGDRKERKGCSIAASMEMDWFLNHYPLLGGLASAFTITEDYKLCRQLEIQIAAVDAEEKVIYLNPAAGLTKGQLRFVFAHEMLHAGLMHGQRCMGRNPYLWNVACDYVINDWLYEMEVGTMPEQVLYDEALHGMSAEGIYDLLVTDLRKNLKKDTFRGYGKGDVLGKGFGTNKNGVSLDEFYRNALAQGLEYHQQQNRGYLPSELVEEIRALSMPAIPWDVKLAEWFQLQFPDKEKLRSYARPSRRQSSTPDIPRPGIRQERADAKQRTFGVVIDTSGSMDTKLLGKALGSVVSLAVAKEVPYVRVVFCDAKAYDAGHLMPEELAGRVEVTGRGGTVLQPGVDLLKKAEDFPKGGPILVITDGYIEKDLKISGEHAFLIPRGNSLPFVAKGKVFYFQ